MGWFGAMAFSGGCGSDGAEGRAERVDGGSNVSVDPVGHRFANHLWGLTPVSSVAARFPHRLLDGYKSFVTDSLPSQSERYRELAETGQSPENCMLRFARCAGDHLRCVAR